MVRDPSSLPGFANSDAKRAFASLILALQDKGGLRYAGDVGAGLSGLTPPCAGNSVRQQRNDLANGDWLLAESAVAMVGFHVY